MHKVSFPPGFELMKKVDTGPIPDCPLCNAKPYDWFGFHYIEAVNCSNEDCPLFTGSFGYDEWRTLSGNVAVLDEAKGSAARYLARTLGPEPCEATCAPEVLEDENETDSR